jgi:hypothetical protein
MIDQARQTKTLEIPLDKGPQIVEANRGEPLKDVKSYAAEVRRDIDWELVERSIDFMKRQKTAGKPFFLYLPISRTHFPNLPSKRLHQILVINGRILDHHCCSVRPADRQLADVCARPRCSNLEAGDLLQIQRVGNAVRLGTQPSG